jgi:hypothetical protein
MDHAPTPDPITPLEHELVDCNNTGRASAEFVAELLAADFLVPEMRAEDGSIQHLLVTADTELFLCVFTSLPLTAGAHIDEGVGDRIVMAPFYEVARLASDMGTGLAINPDLDDEGFGETLSGWLPAPFVHQMALRATAFEYVDSGVNVPEGLLDLVAAVCAESFPLVEAAYSVGYAAAGRDPALMLAFELDENSNPNELVPDLWNAIEQRASELAANLADIELMVLESSDGWDTRRFYERDVTSGSN